MPLVLERRTGMPVPPERLWAWHAAPGSFERLAPPWEEVRVVRQAAALADGERVELRIPRVPFRGRRWVAEIRDVRPGEGFRDVQVEGPFAAWEHEHRMERVPGGASVLADRVAYALPFGALGRLAAPAVRARLARLFAYRHAVTRGDLAQIAALGGLAPMRIVVTGASGLVGSALVPFLTAAGHDVVSAVRGTPGPGEIGWHPTAGGMSASGVAGAGAVVHLAGENIAGARWSAAVKERIRASRVDGTTLVARTVAAASPRPGVLVCASAVGFYGDRGDEEVDEGAPRGEGFLPETCEAWERAADPARDAGVRVVHLRFGVVLSPRGGALAKMLPPFRLGLGGVLGSGRQWMPWISIDDAIGAVLHAIGTPGLTGAVNAVSPGAATNREFTRTLGRVLGRPAILPMPAFAARLAFGEMADPLLLTGARVRPRRLAETGYAFRHADLESALRHVLGR